MGFYSTRILPRLLDLSMSSSGLQLYRARVLAQAYGEVLEIGFGSGLNLPYYPAHVRKITTVDANPGMNKLALKRIEASPIAVENHVLNGERLPFENEAFDTIVSTWTLCSIAKVEQALSELRRVLKPSGRFLFIEHGLSPDPKVQVWQQRLTPFQRKLADGCHLNRNIKQLILDQQFQLQELKEFYIDQTPKFEGYMYQGIATR